MTITLWKQEPDVLIHQALGKACEEASELANILARCLIQGLDQCEPVSGEPNRKALSDEIADLDAAVQWLRELTGEEYDEERADRKLKGFRQWQRMLEADMIAPSPETNVVGGEGTRSAGEQRGTDDRLNRSHVGNDHHGLSVLVGHVDRHREGVAGLEKNSGQELLQTLDGFSPNLPNVGAFRADVINTLHTVVEVEKIAGQDQAPSVERADQSLVEPHGKAHEIANIAQSLMADKPSDPFGQKCTVPAPETKQAGSLLLKEASPPTTSRLSQLEARTSWTASGEPSTTLAQDDKGEER